MLTKNSEMQVFVSCPCDISSIGYINKEELAKDHVICECRPGVRVQRHLKPKQGLRIMVKTDSKHEQTV